MSAFALEDGVVYHTYSAYARGLDALWGMYQWLDRAPMGRNETGHLVPPPRRVLVEPRQHVVHPSPAGGLEVLTPQTSRRTRMKLHANARLTPLARLLRCRRVLEDGRALAEAAEAAGVSAHTARKWLARYRAEGEAGLLDRSSRPHRVPRRTDPARARAALALRRTRMTAQEIAACLGIPERTVSRILRRAGLGRLRALEPAEPANRFETPRPGQLVHVDVKKLARIDGAGHRVTGSRRGQRKGRVGWERVHCGLDGATRLAYSEVLPDERAETACASLRRAVAWFATQGIRVERILTQGGAAYRSRAHRAACAELGLRHSRTRAYRPRTNGKVERFIKTLAEGWAYGQVYTPRPSAPRRWRPGCAPTITIDPTAPSIARRRPRGLAWLLGNNVMATHN